MRLPSYLPWVGIILIMVVAYYFRVVNVHDIVFSDTDQVELLGVDPYFYQRHAEYTTAHYPRIQKFDLATHYPTGVVADAAGLYPVIIASISQAISFGRPTETTVALVCAYLPPIIAAFTYFLVFLIASHMAGPIGGILAACLYLIFPGQALPRSVLGFTDHHILEILFLLGILYSIILAFKGDSGKKLFPYLLGIPFGLAFTIWAGAPLYILVLGFTLLVCMTVIGFNNIPFEKNKWTFAKYLGGSFGTLLFISLLWPDLLTVNQSDVYSKVFIGFCLLGAFPPLYQFVLKKKPFSQNHKLWSLGILVLLTGTIWLFLNHTALGKEIYFWLNFKYVGLIENRKVSHDFFQSLFGYYGYIAVCSSLGLSILAFYRPKRWSLLWVGIPTMFLILFWLNTYDLDYMPGPFMAICSACSILILHDLARPGKIVKQTKNKTQKKGKTKHRKKRKSKSWAYHPAFPIGIAALPLLISFIPIFTKGPFFLPYTETEYIKTAKFYPDHWFDAMEWLQKNTPKPTTSVAGQLDKTLLDRESSDYQFPDGTYGVISAWDFGNLINVKGKRFPTWSRWPSSVETDWMYAQNERESLNQLCPKCQGSEQVKYAIIDAQMVGNWVRNKLELGGKEIMEYTEQRSIQYRDQAITIVDFNHLYKRSIVNQLHRFSGNGLDHYRLVYDSPHLSSISTISRDRNLFKRNFPIRSEEEFNRLSQYVKSGPTMTENGLLHNSYIDSDIKIFEIVKGAVITGLASGNSRLKCALELQSNTSGKTRMYTKETTVDSTGKFTLILPYSTESISGSALTPTGNYELQITKENQITDRISFVVSEQLVQSGDTLIIELPGND